ncbi:S1 family peptidase [Butyrivibrio sp. XPD2002]|uniref:S1 family peptidase n=1 Tax=Butyrivibrio sp. XPD2002 TaxID=1280665 RepID=UPI000417A945|nr:serine protease [Butyrivibrio sp. XPD2002]
MALLPQNYVTAVVSIGRRNPLNKNDLRWFGTGFFVLRPENGSEDRDAEEREYTLYLVTNKHVLEGENTIVIRLKRKDTDELVIIDLPLLIDNKACFSNHIDPNVDIAAVFINPEIVQKNNLNFYGYVLDTNVMESDEYIKYVGYEGGSVFMIGFPIPQMTVGKYSNTPICRGGCIARMDPDLMKDEKKFLVDIHNYPGNSGSPIIARPEIGSLKGTEALNRAVLVGIVNSYIPYRERLINEQTKEAVEIRSENSGLAFANPAEYIKETVELERKRIDID